MNPSKKNRRPPCDRLYEDDGVDPRHYLSRERPRTSDHRTERLCAELGRITEYFLHAECEDPRLEAATLRRVIPADDLRRITLEIAVRPGVAALPPEALDAVAARLRAELAHVAQRRRTPAVALRLVPNEEDGS